MSGKGSKQRPSSVDRDTWDKNWKRIFGKQKPKKWQVDFWQRVADILVEDYGLPSVKAEYIVSKYQSGVAHLDVVYNEDEDSIAADLSKWK